jgi:hypothetical protein
VPQSHRPKTPQNGGGFWQPPSPIMESVNVRAGESLFRLAHATDRATIGRVTAWSIGCSSSLIFSSLRPVAIHSRSILVQVEMIHWTDYCGSIAESIFLPSLPHGDGARGLEEMSLLQVYSVLPCSPGLPTRKASQIKLPSRTQQQL